MILHLVGIFHTQHTAAYSHCAFTGIDTLEPSLDTYNNLYVNITTDKVGIGTTTPTSKLHVVGNTLITGITTIGLANTSTPPNSSQMSFELTSDTNLRIKVRDSQGNLKTANITLA